jgi:hypothetical protein
VKATLKLGVLSLIYKNFNPLNAKLNLICHLLALLGTHHILHVSGVRVKLSSGEWTEVFIFPDLNFAKFTLVVILGKKLRIQ